MLLLSSVAIQSLGLQSLFTQSGFSAENGSYLSIRPSSQPATFS